MVAAGATLYRALLRPDLHHTLAIVLTAAALGVLSKAGVPMSPFALVGIPLALAVVSVIVHRRRAAADESRRRPALNEA